MALFVAHLFLFLMCFVFLVGGGNGEANISRRVAALSATILKSIQNGGTRAASLASARCANATSHKEGAGPLTALCVVGSARSFTSPLVFGGYSNNLVRGLGGTARIFIMIKSTDSTKKGLGPKNTITKTHFAPAEEVKEELEKAFATAPWMVPLLAEVVVLNGSGSPKQIEFLSGEGISGQTKVRIVPSDDGAWLQYVAKNCSRAPFLNFGSNEERLIKDGLSHSWCSEAILREEERMGGQFDRIVYTRPDVFYSKPMKPWCELPPNQMISCDGLSCDKFWIAPRKFLPILNMSLFHRDCSKQECCSYNEALFTYVKRQVANSWVHVPNGSHWQVPPSYFRNIFRAAPIIRDGRVCADGTLSHAAVAHHLAGSDEAALNDTERAWPSLCRNLLLCATVDNF
mmetsp:Transcript_5385/g.10229  ORF Transcript_5385/g.10229 Transcript_5385/m.10229 type:complete len:402 (+) Transcript_5385:662-1867(+)